MNRCTVGVNSLPKTVTRQRRDCDLIPGPSAPESSTLTTRLPSPHNITYIRRSGVCSRSTDRRRRQLSSDICCMRPSSEANRPHVAAAAVDRRDRQTDGRKPDSYIDPAPHTVPGSISETNPVKRTWVMVGHAHTCLKYHYRRLCAINLQI